MVPPSRPCTYACAPKPDPLAPCICNAPVIRSIDIANPNYRTLVFVEADARINNWEDSEGKNRSTFNIVQRKSTARARNDRPLILTEPGTLEVLKRGENRDAEN